MHSYVSGLLAGSRAQKLEQAAAAWRAAHPGGSTRPNRSRRHLGTAALRPATARTCACPQACAARRPNWRQTCPLASR
jgi:hypothetical protein